MLAVPQKVRVATKGQATRNQTFESETLFAETAGTLAVLFRLQALRLAVRTLTDSA
jgi:hypothetical protein